MGPKCSLILLIKKIINKLPEPDRTYLMKPYCVLPRRIRTSSKYGYYSAKTIS